MAFRTRFTSRWTNRMDTALCLNLMDLHLGWLSEDWAREWLDTNRLRELRAKLDRLIASLEEQEEEAA